MPQRIRLNALAAIAVVLTAVAATTARLDGDGEPFEIEVPRGLDGDIRIPLDNRLTPEKVALGRRLFFDPILSDDGSTACSTCHDPEHGFAGIDPLAAGIAGRIGRRNAPSLLNRAYGVSQFWDGRVGSLEEQALLPIESETELGSTIEGTLDRLHSDETYVAEFAQVFDDGISATNLARAIASYERTLLSGDSPNDRFTAGEFDALSDEARIGRWIFESGGKCWQCHSGPNFTDEEFHNTGVSWGTEPPDFGRFEITGNDGDRGAFKTPGLRGVAGTAPYMHDGSMATLREVVEFYNDGGIENPYLDELMTPLDLTDTEIDALVAFLEELTGRTEGEVPIRSVPADNAAKQEPGDA